MTWRNTLFTGAALIAAASLTQTAHAQYERTLAGVRLNSSSKTVLLKYGNPDEVVVGTVGVRIPPSGGIAGGQGGFGGRGGYPGGGGGYPGAGGLAGGDEPGTLGGAGFPGGKGGGALPGLGGGVFPGAGGYPGAGGRGGDDGAPALGGGGYPGAGGAGSIGGGFSGGVGRTVSTLSRQQEVTWIYNRSTKNKNGETQIVSYEFLINPNGNVSQIRVVGYTGGNSRTQRGLALGSTYQSMISRYGVHEDLAQASPSLLVASYRKNAHVQFQLLADRNPNTAAPRGYKIIGITIATVE